MEKEILDNLRETIAKNPRNETAKGILQYLERGDEFSAKNFIRGTATKLPAMTNYKRPSKTCSDVACITKKIVKGGFARE